MLDDTLQKQKDQLIKNANRLKELEDRTKLNQITTKDKDEKFNKETMKLKKQAELAVENKDNANNLLKE